MIICLVPTIDGPMVNAVPYSHAVLLLLQSNMNSVDELIPYSYDTLPRYRIAR